MKIFNLKIPFTKNKAIEKPVKKNIPSKDFRASYTGNSTGGNYRSGGAKWNGGMAESGMPMIYDHHRLRNNGRKAYQDSVNAHGLVGRYADSVADVGLKLDCSPNYKLLGITPEDAEAWSVDVEERFNLWCKSKKQNRSETQDFYQTHRFYQKNKKRDGEIFVRLYYSSDRNLLNPLQFEFIDPNQIRGDAFTSTAGPYASEDGIERDVRGREKSYKIWNSKIVNGVHSFEYTTVPKLGSKSKKVFMLHCFEPEYAGQRRGFSGLAHFLQEFELLTNFKLAHIQKAINQSNIVAAIENNVQDPSNPTENMQLEPPGGAGFGIKSVDENENGVSSSSDDRFDISSCQPNEINTQTPGSTTFWNTKMGDKINFLKDTAPADNFKDFENAFLSSLASSDGMPLSVLKMEMNGSYSAARGELLMFWRSIMIGRYDQASDYLNPIFEAWLGEEIAANRIKAPGWRDPIIRAAWLNSTWVGGPMPNIDPLKTAKGEKEYLSMSATTGSVVAREHNGSEFSSNVIKNKKAFEEMPVPPWEKQEASVDVNKNIDIEEE